MLLKIYKNDQYQRSLASEVYKFFDIKSSGGDIKNEKNVRPARFGFSYSRINWELHKLIIRNVKKRRIYSPFTDNIWGADLEDRQLISKFN